MQVWIDPDLCTGVALCELGGVDIGFGPSMTPSDTIHDLSATA